MDGAVVGELLHRIGHETGPFKPQFSDMTDIRFRTLRKVHICEGFSHKERLQRKGKR